MNRIPRKLHNGELIRDYLHLEPVQMTREELAPLEARTGCQSLDVDFSGKEISEVDLHSVIELFEEWDPACTSLKLRRFLLPAVLFLMLEDIGKRFDCWRASETSRKFSSRNFLESFLSGEEYERFDAVISQALMARMRDEMWLRSEFAEGASCWRCHFELHCRRTRALEPFLIRWFDAEDDSLRLCAIQFVSIWFKTEALFSDLFSRRSGPYFKSETWPVENRLTMVQFLNPARVALTIRKARSLSLDPAFQQALDSIDEAQRPEFNSH